MHRKKKMVDLKFLRQSDKNGGNKMSLMSLTAVELGKKIKAKEVTVKEAVTEALDAIEKKEGTVNSFVTIDREGALKRAEEVQKLIDDGTLTGLLPEFRLQLRIICVPKECLLPVPLRFYIILSRLTQQKQ